MIENLEKFIVNEQVRYRRWLWWTRFGMGVTALQFTGALYLTFVLVKNFSYDGKSKKCFLGNISHFYLYLYVECVHVWIFIIFFNVHGIL